MIRGRQVAAIEHDGQLFRDRILRRQWSKQFVATTNREGGHAHDLDDVDSPEHWLAHDAARLIRLVRVQIADEDGFCLRELTQNEVACALTPGWGTPCADGVCSKSAGPCLKPHLQQPIRIGEEKLAR